MVLSDVEREMLERWARRPKSAQALALRCRIVLACAEGGHNSEVAERLGIHRDTVRKWRRRFLADRLDGLHDEPRPGTPRTIGDDAVETVIVKTLERRAFGLSGAPPRTRTSRAYALALLTHRFSVQSHEHSEHGSGPE